MEGSDFERILEDVQARSDLERIAEELRAIEGYLLLQDIDLSPHCRFVRGMAHYLRDETDEALRALRRGTQDSSVRDLQLFSIYWEAKLHIALGKYSQAEHVFRSGERYLPVGVMQYVEFAAMEKYVRFFQIAESSSATRAKDRFAAVENILVELQQIAEDFHISSDKKASTRTSHEIADSRGDVLSWVAYQGESINAPLPTTDVAQAKALALGAVSEFDGTVLVGNQASRKTLVGEPDGVVRAWALLQAKTIYGREVSDDTPDFRLTFGRVECDFMLSYANGDIIEKFEAMEEEANNRLPDHREQREKAELAMYLLVCACRRYYLHPSGTTDDREKRTVETEVKRARKDLLEKASEVRDRELRIYSPLQGRPLRHDDFLAEAEGLYRRTLGSASE